MPRAWSQQGRSLFLKFSHWLRIYRDPTQIGAFILTKMTETAKSYLEKTVSKAVITVPDHSNDAQRQATRNASDLIYQP